MVIARLKSRPTSEEVETMVADLADLREVHVFESAEWHLVDDARNMLRRLSAQSDVWRAIESAPKDGTEILLGHWNDRFDNVGGHWHWFARGHWHEHWSDRAGGAWSDGLAPEPLGQPTHWRPLPSPPSAPPAVLVPQGTASSGILLASGEQITAPASGPDAVARAIIYGSNTAVVPANKEWFVYTISSALAAAEKRVWVEAQVKWAEDRARLLAKIASLDKARDG